ncbi:DUF397 domain-containing protein [Streptomyces sp. JHA19]|uniref:DUF397 domain-containing protein n=1 Tax=Streptomyces sp. JHA19 TaxID=1577588 RepID=UPI0006E3A05E|nr:DUF397 domain-containing protein [Streptomyces sp. JHA19]
MTGTGNLRWFKSSYSDGRDGQCLEVAPSLHPTPTIHIRDSKNPDGSNLTVSGRAWADFLPAATVSR